MSSSVAVLDACVMFPQALRDALLRIAEADLYEVRWTEEILEEVRRNLVNKGHMPGDKALRLIKAMNIAFGDASVTDYKDLIPSMTNDPKDRHVAAAAVACKAQFIVTFNLRHFPRAALSPYQIKVQSPDAFLCDLLSKNLIQIQHVIQSQAQEYHKPSMTLDQLLNILAKQVPQLVKLLRQSFNLPPQ